MKLTPWLLAASAALFAACQTVPITGRSQMQFLGEGQEMRMGLTSYQDILKKEKVSDDPELNAQIQRVGRRIAAATGKNYQWEFKVIENDKTINAFCLPGGKVAVYTGLLPVTQDDAGLAAVIGHEVAHAIARHGGERLSQQMLVAGLTAAVVVSSSDSRKANLYAGLLGAGAAVGYLLPYSRLQESEADRMGLVYMAKAGYDPHASLELWKRMAEAAKRESKPPEFLSTHPADSTRIRQIQDWLPEAMQYYKPVPEAAKHGK
ncbi:lipoprotein [Azospira sp. I13]|uniref:M48 family metallopeptidase n=1 Tax=Azospira sp. I13 TaxID=1765050 RepID=UPI000D4921B6|nr:M48 family metallopeptidase [Azospira sp. I13]GBG01816.1 lipoprotein [Azospira sp. I13]